MSTIANLALPLILAAAGVACARQAAVPPASSVPPSASTSMNATAAGEDVPLPAWQPSAGHAQIPLWPAGAPDPQAVGTPENQTFLVKSRLVAGKSWIEVGRVSQPTMTVYSPPPEKNTGAAVVVFPGGGYRVLAIDLEGTETCDWLTSRGITCVLLKYRVPGLQEDREDPAHPKPCTRTDACDTTGPTSGPYPQSPLALEDAQRAIGLLRLRAAEWNIDPRKIGVIGFSAGGHLVAAISTGFARRLYPAVDAADRESCRPDFAMVLYPGHLSLEPDVHALTPDVKVTRQTPPTFIVQAEDDPVDPVENSLVYYAALRKAEVPVEMHLFARGRHAYGLRRTENEITRWPDLADTWMRSIGVIPR